MLNELFFVLQPKSALNQANDQTVLSIYKWTCLDPYGVTDSDFGQMKIGQKALSQLFFGTEVKPILSCVLVNEISASSCFRIQHICKLSFELGQQKGFLKIDLGCDFLQKVIFLKNKKIL